MGLYEDFKTGKGLTAPKTPATNPDDSLLKKAARFVLPKAAEYKLGLTQKPEEGGSEKPTQTKSLFDQFKEQKQSVVPTPPVSPDMPTPPKKEVGAVPKTAEEYMASLNVPKFEIRASKPGEFVQKESLPQEAQNYITEKSQPKKFGLDTPARVLDIFGSGIISTFEGMVGAAEWLSPEIMKPFLNIAGKEIKQQREKVEPKDLSFPEKVVAGAGSAASFFVPGFGVSKVATGIAKVSPRIALLFGGSTATALEAMTEAGSVYKEEQEKGSDESQSSWAATKTFWANAVLIGITNALGPFSDSVQGAIKRALVSAPLEGVQEFGQTVISNVNTGKEDIYEGAWESAVIGTILGVPMGLVGSGVQPKQAKETIENRFSQDTPPGSKSLDELGVESENYTARKEAPESTKTAKDLETLTPASFAQRIINGEDITSPDDIQFYKNNETEIETELSKAPATQATDTETGKVIPKGGAQDTYLKTTMSPAEYAARVIDRKLTGQEYLRQSPKGKELLAQQLAKEEVEGKKKAKENQLEQQAGDIVDFLLGKKTTAEKSKTEKGDMFALQSQKPQEADFEAVDREINKRLEKFRKTADLMAPKEGAGVRTRRVEDQVGDLVFLANDFKLSRAKGDMAKRAKDYKNYAHELLYENDKKYRDLVDKRDTLLEKKSELATDEIDVKAMFDEISKEEAKIDEVITQLSKEEEVSGDERETAKKDGSDEKAETKVTEEGYSKERLSVHDEIIARLLPTREINADKVKEEMPGYEEYKKNPTYEFHKESNHIFSKLLSKKIASYGGKGGKIGINIGVPGAGKSTVLKKISESYDFYIDYTGIATDKVLQNIRQLKNNGFSVDLNLVHVSEEASLKAQEYRKSQGERYLTEEQVKKYTSLPEKTFFELKKYADNWSLFSNEDFNNPIAVAKKQGSDLTILDNSLYSNIRLYARKKILTKPDTGLRDRGSRGRGEQGDRNVREGIEETEEEVTPEETQPPTQAEGGFNLEKLEARDVATHLIRTYVERGDTYESIKNSHMGYSSESAASIGGYVNGKSVKNDKIVVTRLNGVDLTKPEIFSLKELFNEIKNETKPGSVEVQKEKKGKIKTLANSEQVQKIVAYQSIEEARKDMTAEGQKSIFDQPLTQMDYVMYKFTRNEQLPQELNYLAVEMFREGVLKQTEPGTGVQVDVGAVLARTSDEEPTTFDFKLSEEVDMDGFPNLDAVAQVADYDDLQAGFGINPEGMNKGDVVESTEIMREKLNKKGKKITAPSYGILEDVFDDGQALVKTERGYRNLSFYNLAQVNPDTLRGGDKKIVDRLLSAAPIEPPPPVREIEQPPLFQVMDLQARRESTISRQEVKKTLEKYFGKYEVPVEFVDKIVTADGEEAFAKYHKQMLTFVNNPSAEAPHHEAVHAFLDLFTTPTKKNAYLARTLENKRKEIGSVLVEERISQVRSQYRNKISQARAAKIYAEEILADDFVNYVYNQERKTPMKQLFDRVISFLRRIADPTNAKNLYEDIINKKRQSREKIQREKISYFKKQENKFAVTTKMLNKMASEIRVDSVGRGTIQQYLNREGITKQDKELLSETLNEYAGEKIPVAEFIASVKAKIMPVSLIRSTTYADYGVSNLRDLKGGENSFGAFSLVAETHIWDTPFKHGQVGHFSADLSNKDVKYRIEERTNPDTKKPIFFVLEADVTPNRENVQDIVATVADTREDAQTWINGHAEKTRKEVSGLLGHTRVASTKGKEHLLAELNKDIKVEKELVDFHKSGLKEVEKVYKEFSKNKDKIIERLNTAIAKMIGPSEAGFENNLSYLIDSANDYLNRESNVEKYGTISYPRGRAYLEWLEETTGVKISTEDSRMAYDRAQVIVGNLKLDGGKIVESGFLDTIDVGMRITEKKSLAEDHEKTLEKLEQKKEDVEKNPEKVEMVRHILEVQSDPMQSRYRVLGVVEKAAEEKQSFEFLRSEIGKEVIYENRSRFYPAIDIYNETQQDLESPRLLSLEYVPTGKNSNSYEILVRNSMSAETYMRSKFLSTEPEEQKRILGAIDKHIKESADKLEKAKLEQGSIERQFFAVGSKYHERAIKEEIRLAANDLVKDNPIKLRIGTPFTIELIEGGVRSSDYKVVDGALVNTEESEEALLDQKMNEEIPKRPRSPLGESADERVIVPDGEVAGLESGDFVEVDGQLHQIEGINTDGTVVLRKNEDYETLPYDWDDPDIEPSLGDSITYEGRDYQVVELLDNSMNIALSDRVRSFSFNDFIQDQVEMRLDEARGDISDLAKEYGPINSVKQAQKVLEKEGGDLNWETELILQTMFEDGDPESNDLDVSDFEENASEKLHRSESELFSDEREWRNMGNEAVYFDTSNNDQVTLVEDGGNISEVPIPSSSYVAFPKAKLTEEDISAMEKSALVKLGALNKQYEKDLKEWQEKVEATKAKYEKLKEEARNKEGKAKTDKDGVYIFDPEIGLNSKEARTVYKYYEKNVIPFFRKYRKDAKLVTDERGIQWWETQVTENDKGPIEVYLRKNAQSNLPPISDGELQAFNLVQKGSEIPPELMPAIQLLKDRGLLRQDYKPPVKPSKVKRARGTPRPFQPGQKIRQRGITLSRAKEDVKRPYTLSYKVGEKRVTRTFEKIEDVYWIYNAMVNMRSKNAMRRGELPPELQPTDQQKATIHAIADSKKITPNQYKRLALAYTGVDSTLKMTPEQATHLIDMLKALKPSFGGKVTVPKTTGLVLQETAERSFKNITFGWVLNIFRTPRSVFRKIGIGPEVSEVYTGLDLRKDFVNKTFGKISEWQKELGIRGARVILEKGKLREQSARMFRAMNTGDLSGLTEQEALIVERARQLANGIADQVDDSRTGLGLSPMNRRENYITNLLTDEGHFIIQNTKQAPNELYALLDMKLPAKVFDRLLLERKGGLPIKEDFWQALKAMTQMHAKYIFLNPPIHRLERFMRFYGDKIPYLSRKYITGRIKRFLGRPTMVESFLRGLDESITKHFSRVPFMSKKFELEMQNGMTEVFNVPRINLTVFQNAIPAMKSLRYMYDLTWSVSFYTLNLTQFWLNTVPKLRGNALEIYRSAATGYAQMMVDFFRPSKWEYWRQRGVLTEIDNVIDNEYRARFGGDVLNIFAKLSEFNNRVATAIAVEKNIALLQKKGKADLLYKELNKRYGEEAKEFARQLADLTQFRYGITEKPVAFDNPIMDLYYQYNTFALKQAELVEQMALNVRLKSVIADFRKAHQEGRTAEFLADLTEGDRGEFLRFSINAFLLSFILGAGYVWDAVFKGMIPGQVIGLKDVIVGLWNGDKALRQKGYKAMIKPPSWDLIERFADYGATATILNAKAFRQLELIRGIVTGDEVEIKNAAGEVVEKITPETAMGRLLSSSKEESAMANKKAWDAYYKIDASYSNTRTKSLDLIKGGREQEARNLVKVYNNQARLRIEKMKSLKPGDLRLKEILGKIEKSHIVNLTDFENWKKDAKK